MTLHARDPDAIAFGSAQAVAYADEVEALGVATGAEPVMRLEYGPDRGQRLDVYAPPKAENLPVLLFFHGGSWINGHLGWLRFMAPAVTAMPAVLVAATYRLAPRRRWPAQYEDAREALAVVAAQVRQFGGDPSRIVVGGHSAGGHLAALLTLKGETATTLRGCFPVSSPFDLQYGDIPEDSQDGRAYKYLLHHRRQDYEASPINFVGGARTPFHLMWGDEDTPRIITSGEAMVQALRASGCPVSAQSLPGASHFDTHLALADPGHSWYSRLREAFGA